MITFLQRGTSKEVPATMTATVLENRILLDAISLLNDPFRIDGENPDFTSCFDRRCEKAQDDFSPVLGWIGSRNMVVAIFVSRRFSIQ